MGRLRNLFIHPCDEVATDNLSKRLSEVIIQTARLRGINQSNLARQMGFSRAALCGMLAGNSDGTRRWGLWHLCSVSRILGIPVSKLIAAAEEPFGNLLLEEQKELLRREAIAAEKKQLQARWNALREEEEKLNANTK